MSPQDVLAEVEGSGFRLTLRPGGLRLTGGAAPPPNVLALIREHRGALVEALEVKARAQAAHQESLNVGRVTSIAPHIVGWIHPSIRHLVATRAGTTRRKPQG